MIGKKDPLEVEWKKLQKRETLFFKRREAQKEGFLNRALEEKVPEKMQQSLNVAFAKAFEVVFEKGTGIIEKTIRREEQEKTYQINAFSHELRKDKKSLNTFSKTANSHGIKNLLFSGASGIGMGFLGIGLPDIPVFTAMMLKGIYETALSYGFGYETELERCFILLIIEGAVSAGSDFIEADSNINAFIEQEQIPDAYDRSLQIRKTADNLSKELLCMKFLQGIPVVGAVGGAFDAFCMKQILEYAQLKYRRRFLMKKRSGASAEL